MKALQDKAKSLLESGGVQVVVGYAAGSTPDRVRPFFARKPDQVAELVWTDKPVQNLATYLLKPEVRALGKAALVATPAALRTLLQYAVENQIADGGFVALAVDGSAVAELPTLAAIEEHVAKQPRGLSQADVAEIAKIDALSREERWAFWNAEMGHCVKCYACRAACPLCYCSRCITENNQPQWLPVSADPLGNLEWNIVRAMHLAGRCIGCGSCATACPQGIRIDLLNHVLAHEALQQFGAEAGAGTRREYALSTYQPDDKEDFIR